MFCSKCGPDVHVSKFNHSGTICDDCWVDLDMDRFKEVRPAKGEAPIAPVTKLSNGIGVLCPHCDHKVTRSYSYYQKAEQIERCPACMEHYIVKPRRAK